MSEEQPARAPKPGPLARTYDPAANPEGAYLPGVPLDDITIAEWEGLPLWLQRSIDALAFYQVAPGGPERAVHPPDDAAPAEHSAPAGKRAKPTKEA